MEERKMGNTTKGMLSIRWIAGGRALLLALLLATSFGAAGALSPSEDLLVPAGETLVATGSLHLGDLTVLGTLRMDAPGGWVISARNVRVGADGAIQGFPGADG